MSEQTVLEVKGLEKTFHIGFFRKRVEAVRGIDFSVRAGEIFGLLGPNGAGKTTSIKMILSLIFPSAGEISIFGKPPGDLESKRRIGYLPENPYVYQYLKPTEFLDLCGRLTGLDAKRRRERTDELLERVGLAHARERPIGKFSKGMMQRVGLAQAILHDPELLILDEPMSGLDPIGRKEVRDLLLEQRAAGKTLLFTSHILSDVEMICDRVTILQSGEVTAAGTMAELLAPVGLRTELTLEDVGEDLAAALSEAGVLLRRREQQWVAEVEGDAVQDTLLAAIRGGARVAAVTPHRRTLEGLFVRDAGESEREGR